MGEEEGLGRRRRKLDFGRFGRGWGRVFEVGKGFFKFFKYYVREFEEFRLVLDFFGFLFRIGFIYLLII